MSEASFQGAVLEIAALTGWLAYHPHDSRRSEPGFPDLTLVRERLVFAELKSDTGKLRPEQQTWFDALLAAGIEVYVWRPQNWPQIMDTLKRKR